MKKRFFTVLMLGALAAVPLAALDRDFHAVGDGADAPAKLDVYRRAKGYTVLVTTDGRAATVTAKKAGKLVFTLDEKGSVTLPDGKEIAAQPVVRGKAHWGYFVPDTVSGLDRRLCREQGRPAGRGRRAPARLRPQRSRLQLESGGEHHPRTGQQHPARIRRFRV